eukprot:CAMPEP_0113303816 /NCGR_PEP_ID=MMETSP0010_2-20120614/4071_1 /TAXON_ID=216773 ORGANISM="Corethron hystrix, Strain 308" /NCGR_SAMPLE_ID=MMETSP0010_2 /ASSEMBLY_ACC=CAM_ASM_000155 /LENGTH=227 /DNA_ID=CAMNT_0000157869 /DNA_START=94 /DNA_END=774 /DNA_ORIENTATION=- /assembly_acc=CAM_ASM_000155
MPSGTENETDQQRSTAGHNGPVAAKEAAVRQKENKRMFSQYEREHSATLVKVRRILARTGVSTSDSLHDGESLLIEADALTDAMLSLAESSNAPFNMIWKKKAERCKAEVGPLKEEIKRGLLNMQELARSRLCEEYRTNAEYAMSSTDDPFGPRAMETAGLLNDQHNLLEESQRLCAESEEIGASTLGTMGIQRDQLESTSARLQETLTTTEQARIILNNMIRKALW